MMKKAFFLAALLVASVAARAQENNTWWESYNQSSMQSMSGDNQTVARKSRNAFATKLQLSLNLGGFSGDGSDDFDPDLGFNLGISEDFMNNSTLGVEAGIYYSKYATTFGGTSEGHFKARMHFLEFQLMLDPRVFIDENALELNIGLGYNFGFSAPVSYVHGSDETDLDLDLFEGTGNSKATLKDASAMFLIGATYRFEKGYIRTLYHKGLTNMVNDGTGKTYLWNWDLSIGFIF